MLVNVAPPEWECRLGASAAVDSKGKKTLQFFIFCRCRPAPLLSVGNFLLQKCGHLGGGIAGADARGRRVGSGSQDCRKRPAVGRSRRIWCIICFRFELSVLLHGETIHRGDDLRLARDAKN